MSWPESPFTVDEAIKLFHDYYDKEPSVVATKTTAVIRALVNCVESTSATERAFNSYDKLATVVDHWNTVDSEVVAALTIACMFKDEDPKVLAELVNAVASLLKEMKK